MDLNLKKGKKSIEIKHKKDKKNKQKTLDKLILKVKQLFANQKRLVVLLVIILLNNKVIVIEIDQYQLLDILIILENI